MFALRLSAIKRPQTARVTMVEKVVASPNVALSNKVVDLTRYQTGRNAAGKLGEISVRICRHCNAVLFEGEREEECSSVFNINSPSFSWQTAQISCGSF